VVDSLLGTARSRPLFAAPSCARNVQNFPSCRPSFTAPTTSRAWLPNAIVTHCRASQPRRRARSRVATPRGERRPRCETPQPTRAVRPQGSWCSGISNSAASADARSCRSTRTGKGEDESPSWSTARPRGNAARNSSTMSVCSLADAANQWACSPVTCCQSTEVPIDGRSAFSQSKTTPGSSRSRSRRRSSSS
jgi:hypothetical protein